VRGSVDVVLGWGLFGPRVTRCVFEVWTGAMLGCGNLKAAARQRDLVIISQSCDGSLSEQKNWGLACASAYIVHALVVSLGGSQVAMALGARLPVPAALLALRSFIGETRSFIQGLSCEPPDKIVLRGCSQFRPPEFCSSGSWPRCLAGGLPSNWKGVGEKCARGVEEKERDLRLPQVEGDVVSFDGDLIVLVQNTIVHRAGPPPAVAAVAHEVHDRLSSHDHLGGTAQTRSLGHCLSAIIFLRGIPDVPKTGGCRGGASDNFSARLKTESKPSSIPSGQREGQDYGGDTIGNPGVPLVGHKTLVLLVLPVARLDIGTYFTPTDTSFFPLLL
jgi:hypothetical protein